MATTVAELMVKFGATGVAQTKSDIQSLGQSLDDTARRGGAAASNMLSSWGANMTRVGGIATLALTTPILAFGTSAIMAASDMQETLSKVGVVFGTSGSQINAWGETAATALGLSSNQAQGAAATFGNLLLGMGLTQPAAADMSQGMVELAADLASFNNVPVEEALLAIRSGLVGEAEPMRRFGVLLNESTVAAKAMEMGLVDANGEISEQSKVLARQAIMMEQTGTAQGDFARTSGGLANQMRILQARFRDVTARLATQLLPTVTRMVAGFSKLMDWVGKLSPGMQKVALVAVGLAAAIGPILAFGTSAIMAASDMQETLAKTGVVFGTSAGQINAWGETAATALGLSSNQAQGAAATFGNLLIGMGLTQPAAADMSQGMVELAADLASFNNVPVEEALMAIRSGLVGEAEPMRRFGVLLNESTVAAKAMEMGLVDANGEISEQSKVLARQAIIMEQTGTAQGDFARTSGGLANQMRILKARFSDVTTRLATQLLPAVTRMVAGFSKLVDWVSKLSPGMQKVALVAVGLAAAIGPILVAVGGLMLVIGPVIGALGGMAGIMGVVGAAFAVLTGPIGLVVLALVGLYAAYQTNFLGFGDGVRMVAGWIGDAIGAVVEAFSRVMNYLTAVATGGDYLVARLDRIPGPLQGIAVAAGVVVTIIQDLIGYLRDVATTGDV
ncbi:MAG: hypothetical protein M3440_15070, partial [Chloroflexota bacterium]|nr:hypothetical protein [Chloroflexota bacterium]